ncbi:MAG: Uma2 family endonuclease [Planctomycetota bacterium]
MASVETPVLKLDRHSNGMLLDPWEFDAARFEKGWRYELLNGVLVVNAAPLRNERDPNEELGRWLRNYQEDHPNGDHLDATMSEETIVIGLNRRRVDRAIWAGLGRLPGTTEAPTIAVEFVSQGAQNRQRDYETKRHEYRSIGVREYWIIDRFERRMTVHQFERSKEVTRTFSTRQTYTTPLLPGFKLPIGKLIKLAERWEEEQA